MTVEAENLVEQFLAEPVHHRHHDDQRRDAEHDADEREGRDDGNESFTPPRAQVAQRQHPLEGSEGAGPDRIAHQCPSNIPHFIRFWRVWDFLVMATAGRCLFSGFPSRLPGAHRGEGLYRRIEPLNLSAISPGGSAAHYSRAGSPVRPQRGEPMAPPANALAGIIL